MKPAACRAIFDHEDGSGKSAGTEGYLLDPAREVLYRILSQKARERPPGFVGANDEFVTDA
jgi:hypothetical protein